MKRISILCALVALACTSLFANPNIVPIGGSKYARLSEDKTFISTGDYKTGKEDTLLVFSKMRVNPLDSVEAFLFSPDGNRILLRASFENYYVYKIESRRSDKLSTIGTQSKPMFSPDGKKIAFVRRHNIYVKRLEYDTEVVVTEDGSESVYNGLRSPEFEKAFGTDVTMEWSPDGMYLLYTKNQNVYMYSMQYKWNKLITLPDKDAYYITRIAWTSKPETFSIMYLNKAQTVLRMAKVDAASLVAKRVYEYVEDRYISPDVASFVMFFPENDNFVVLEERDDYKNLYLYSSAGSYIKALTKANYDITKVYGYDVASQRIFYQSTENGPDNRGIYAMGVQNAKKTALSVTTGTNEASFSADYKFYELRHSAINSPDKYSICDIKGAELRVLEQDTVLEILHKEMYDFCGMSGWILRKDTLKHPLVMWVTEAKNQWNMDFAYRLVNEGYTVAAVNTRGTIGYGERFKKAVYGDMFVIPAQDYALAARCLVEQGKADAANMFIIGSGLSGGVVLAALSQTDSPFKGGIAIAPVSDLASYNVAEVERLMQAQGATLAYKTNSAIYNAANIKGKLLLVHAMNDKSMPLDNTLRLTEALVDANVQFDMQLYPNRDENFTMWLTQKHVFGKVMNFLKINTK